MALSVGAILKGAKWNYRLVQNIGKGSQLSSLFKAQVLAGSRDTAPAKWAFVKTTSPERLKFLQREHDYYIKPEIARSPHFRKMYDTVGDWNEPGNVTSDFAPKGLVFEWMDCTLDQVDPRFYQRKPMFVKSVSEAVLNALVVLKGLGVVHTDIKPDNVFLSSIDEPLPTVALGDLGTTVVEGFNEYCPQPYAMRAPEVWQGRGCTHVSDIWAFAVTLVEWISPGVFGIRDKPAGHWPSAWCMAKLLRLFGRSMMPPLEETEYRGDFEISKVMEDEKDPDDPREMWLKTLPFKTQLQKMDITPETADFVWYLLVVEPERRPAAEEALESVWYKALG